jgi:hypothetical protein
MSRQVKVSDVMAMRHVFGQVVRPMDVKGEMMFVVVERGKEPGDGQMEGLWVEGLDHGKSHFKFLRPSDSVYVVSEAGRDQYRDTQAWMLLAKRYPEIDW